MKYRVASVDNPNSAELWNNIGMCFFGKKKYVAAVTCLKKAIYLDPFQWIAAFNLGLVYLNTEQYASAFHYFSSAVNLKPDFGNSYMYLGITLSKLNDFDSACKSFDRALEIDPEGWDVCLNYAIVLNNHSQASRALMLFNKSETIYKTLEEDDKDDDLMKARSELAKALGLSLKT